MLLSMLVDTGALVFRAHDRKAVFALADESAMVTLQVVPSEYPTLGHAGGGLRRGGV
ncbi:MAG: hypothetical protein H7224_11345 [Polaromonas sp.]|nr:hypothetical protein [Polaromonas sp.]